MNQQTFQNKRRFAGTLQPSIKRRAVEHDYHERRIYMITIAVEGRRPLLGTLEGEVSTGGRTATSPHVVPSALGKAVTKAWHNIPHYHPEVRDLAFQLMPDHIHGILFVERPIEQGLGKVILGFKQGCNKAYRRLLVAEVGYVAVPQQQEAIVTQRHTQPAARTQGMLFERSYHDRILLHAGQLETMRAYLTDNPYRLALKRAHSDLLRVRLNVNICGWCCSAVGNMKLLHSNRLLQVRISRSIAPDLLVAEQQRLLTAAREGAILVSPSISHGEKSIMRAAFDERLPLIVLLCNGLDPMSKPSGERFYATAEGRLLLLSPFPHHGNKHSISRDECNQLNALAWDITHAIPNHS